MVKEFEAVIIKKHKNGKICKQIKLGDNFLNDINNLSREVLYFQQNQLLLSEKVDMLNYKINSLVANKIIFNLNGIKFTNESEKISSVQATNFSRVAENISEGIYALIFDLKNNNQSGDPQVWKDSISFLLTIYQQLKDSKFFSTLITEDQKIMLENQFVECIELFNKKINDAIKGNNEWLSTYNPISCFFGMMMGYEIDHPGNEYLRQCLFDFKELPEQQKQIVVKKKTQLLK
ncbi:MAG: hypothetical protein MJ176_05930 [Treponema sp.]|nr:hypothetical protein [Treponema sp.]